MDNEKLIKELFNFEFTKTCEYCSRGKTKCLFELGEFSCVRCKKHGKMCLLNVKGAKTKRINYIDVDNIEPMEYDDEFQLKNECCRMYKTKCTKCRNWEYVKSIISQIEPIGYENGMFIYDEV